MAAGLDIVAIDYWPLRIPLARPYRLSAVYGTLTHGLAVAVRITLANGITGWGEADPHGDFDGYTLETASEAIGRLADGLIGQSVADWVEQGHGTRHHGAPAAAIDVACYDALAKSRDLPVWALLGEQQATGVDSLWPTSNGEASEDLEIIGEYRKRGFRTYMLKMGDRPIESEISRTQEVMASKPGDVEIMVDANQGWSRAQAAQYLEACSDMPLVLVEQPLPADDLDGLRELRAMTDLPVSVDESMLRPEQVDAIIEADAADVFSIKISKNGGLTHCLAIARSIEHAGKRVLMNSMIELGITQAASLHLGCTLKNLMPCGHAYMSTLRMADDITDFSDWVQDGRAILPDRPGLGVHVSREKIDQYEVGALHVS